ncbi:MAG: long-chain fatty acid--CoA ligase [Mangrovibacterium sp.]
MKTLIELFETSVSRFPDQIFLWEKQEGKYRGTSYKEVHRQVLQFAAGLLATGVRKGDRIGLVSEGRNQWLIAELGVLYAGAVNVPLSVKLDARTEILFRLEHSGSRMVVVSAGQAPKIEEIRNDLPFLEKVIYLDGKENPGTKDLLYTQLMEDGRTFLQNQGKQLEKQYRSVGPDDLANISYTSGTTADPKGIMLSHLNYTANTIQANTLMEIGSDWKTLAFLPWDHSFAHTACLYCFMYNGASVAAPENGRSPMETLKNIPKNIREIQPDILMSVPAVARNFRKGIESRIRQKGKTAQKLFTQALKTAYRYNGNGWNRGKSWRVVYKPLVNLYDRILFSKIRKSFGGRLKFFIGGGALLDIELQRFFFAIGIPMCQGYGLSEASPVISSNALHDIKFGSSGRVVKYLEMKIMDEQGREMPAGEKGEIIIKGNNVMAGYWNNPKATAETVVEGWLHTGDMGYLDPDGFLYVLGRFKSLLIANDGEKFSPEGIEEALTEQSPLIEQCMLHNNQNPYTAGLVVPNIQAVNRKLEEAGLKPGTAEGNSESLKLIQGAIEQYKKGGRFENMFPERWLPATIAVLPEAFTEQNHLLNSSLKMMRNKITAYFAGELKFLYTPEAKNILNKQNLAAVARWNK